MWEDPIVKEVHEIRKKIMEQYGYDMEAMFADMRKRQEALGSALVRQKAVAKSPADDSLASPHSDLDSAPIKFSLPPQASK